MPGTKAGGLKTKQKMIERLGPEGYRNWIIERGSKGGKLSNNSAWALTPEGHAHMVAAGQKGGKATRKKYKEIGDE